MMKLYGRTEMEKYISVEYILCIDYATLIDYAYKTQI